ncbi:GNAT family N-acetyltransferase [Haloarchaeobius sp. DFWS5]|uniref:GNAT family N-acetyltransferase n=1 Tax=Haloarchaeobius sp. DFWS5 TaxID=3446114 RepID=UPI003EBAC709
MLDITTLTLDDVEAGVRLSTQAGWNQVAADWERFLALSPNGCFAGRIDGDVVATTCVATYDDVSWIGMVLVDEDHRRAGYGTELFQRGLDYARDANSSAIGLDATQYGASIYHDHDFEDAGPIERWTGPLDASPDTETAATVLTPSARDSIYELDYATVGVDRSKLLGRLLSEVGTSALGVRDDGSLRAYAILRPGREHPQLGPIVAPDPADLPRLLDGAAGVLTDPCLVVDSFPSPETTEVLERYGLQKRRELVRMSYETDERLLNGSAVHGAVDFAWG